MLRFLLQRAFMSATLIGVLLFTTNTSHAQDEKQPGRQEAQLSFRTELRGPVRVDLDSGVQRAWYRSSSSVLPEDPGSFLEQSASRFGWSDPDDDLELVRDVQRSRSRHQTWQQMFKGIPVSGRTVRLNLDDEGHVSMVTSAFQPVKADPADFDIQPSVAADQAARTALTRLASGAGATNRPRLVIHDPESPRLTWEVLVWPEDEPAEYRAWMDAHTGELLAYTDQALGKHASNEDGGALIPRVDGSGFVFDPDPLFTSGQSYGPPYTDNDDQTNASLDAARKAVTLRDIQQNQAGMWVLEGPYVRIVGQNTSGTSVYDPPAVAGPDDFFFDRSESGFEAVNVYYHVDKNQRYVQSLGILDTQNEGLDINPHGLTRDDSFYFPDRNMIVFGTGGVDDAEDPSVVIHEYGHALLNAAAPGLLGTLEGRALHEGFSDYWQASYYRHLVETGQTLRDDWRWVFLWDSGEGTIWNGRYLDHQGIYPQDLCVTSGSGSCSVHDDGRMWATTLMEVWDGLGRELTDHLVLLSHYYLEAPVTFADAAQAVIQADTDYYDGAHLGLLLNVFSSRGLVDASAYGPVVNHAPLLSTEFSGIAVPVTATVYGVSSPITEVELVYWGATIPETTVAMQPVSGQPDTFEADLMLPGESDTVFYYLRAADQLGNATFEPETAPQEPFSFVVGTDLERPMLNHTPPDEVTFLSWPVRIVGEAQDNFGLQSLSLSWSVEAPDGLQVHSGETIIAEANGPFDVAFPVSLSDLENGSRIRYALEATDASANKNTTRFPESGTIDLTIQAGEILKDYDFSEAPQEFVLDGIWAFGAPEYGMVQAPDGGDVLATVPAGSYPSDPGMSAATLPALNLARVGPTFVRFWHFHDTEYTGTADPSGQGGVLFDGGRVEVRSDANPEWQPLTPLGGYPGRIGTDRQNPLGGQDAFGGFSHGWRRVSFALPQEDGVQLRFLFATDAANDQTADRFAGWMINGLLIATVDDADAGLPVITEVPEPSTIVSTQAALPTVQMAATDDFGIQDAWMDWTLRRDGGESEGSQRMTQEPGQLRFYSAGTDFLASSSPGDELVYHLRVSDASGQEAVSGPFSVTFRLFDTHEALSSVWSTGNWEALEGGWVFRTSLVSLVSTLVLDPRDTETNALQQELIIDHEATFAPGSAGLLEVSIDDGRTWQDLVPADGYTGTALLEPDSPLDRRRAFTGSLLRREDRFDLTPFTGSQVQIRFQAATDGAGGMANHWRLFSVAFQAQTEDDAFEAAPEFELLPAFPNPFTSRTRVTFSLPETGHVVLRIHDALGREVATLTDGVLEAGSHGFTFEAPGLPAGVYFARLQAGGKQTVQTLVHTGR